ncbi:MAG TPA: hypothetical protein VMT03_07310 [Polyangia bacterium]|nr:hypothetical protein [Polyangia bacterium]
MAVVIALAVPARATPRPLPFTYIQETLPQGDAEVELYSDLVPQHVPDAINSPGWHIATQFQAEIEYGITDRLELGLYLTLAPVDLAFPTAPPLTESNGVKQRLRWSLAPAGQWPVDVALYGELAESQREIEFEGKVILQRRVGPFRIAANAWGEREYEFNGEHAWVLNPTAGVVLEKWIVIQPGIEYWMRGEIVGGKFVLGPDHFLGPTALLQFGKIWWSSGLYLHVNELHQPSLEAGAAPAAYGPIWFRTIVGISY